VDRQRILAMSRFLVRGILFYLMLLGFILSLAAQPRTDAARERIPLMFRDGEPCWSRDCSSWWLALCGRDLTDVHAGQAASYLVPVRCVRTPGGINGGCAVLELARADRRPGTACIRDSHVRRSPCAECVRVGRPVARAAIILHGMNVRVVQGGHSVDLSRSKRMVTPNHLVSVVLPTYNRSATIMRAVRSVLTQTYRNLELLVIDDGSNDGTEDILRSIRDPRLRYMRCATNGGVGVARNMGVRAAAGDLVAFQDSDDEWVPWKLERQVELFRQGDRSLGMVYADMLRVLLDGTRIVFPAPTVTRGCLTDREGLEYQVMGIGQQTTVIRRECFDTIGLFDESLPRFIDLEFFVRLLLCYDARRISEQLVTFYETRGISSDKMAGIEARQRLMERYGRRCGRRFLAAQYARIAESYFRLGDARNAICALGKALAASPFCRPIYAVLYHKLTSTL